MFAISVFGFPALPHQLFLLNKSALLDVSQNWLGPPLAIVSYFAPSPSCASQDGFKSLIGNVVHLLLGHDHPLLPVEGGQPLLEKAGQLVSNFACHHFD